MERPTLENSISRQTRPLRRTHGEVDYNSEANEWRGDQVSETSQNQEPLI